MHKSVERPLLQRDYKTGHDHEVLLADVIVGWKYVQHNNNILPHYHHFDVMPRIIGTFEDKPRLFEQVALMYLACQETGFLLVHDLIAHTLGTSNRYMVPINSAAKSEKILFHRYFYGW